jgi:hypothetical protein
MDWLQNTPLQIVPPKRPRKGEILLEVLPSIIPLRTLRLPRHTPLHNIDLTLARRTRRLASKVESRETERGTHDTKQDLSTG